MAEPHTCPLCTDRYERRSDLRVHLEVEHRKSELALFAVERDGDRGDPVVEEDLTTPSA